jgi:hypothetical protein
MTRSQHVRERDDPGHFNAGRRPGAEPRPRADLRSQAEEVLREVAFVLHVTRSVKKALSEEKGRALPDLTEPGPTHRRAAGGR